jgi:S-adenosylmethionine:tRNA ribosyltransferase-isomerase
LSDPFGLEAYDFELPADRIAQEPLPERDASRLLVLDRAAGTLDHRVFRELPQLLREGDLLVLNRSRVFPARLLGRRQGGGTAELLLVRRRGEELWEALVRPGRRLRTGAVVAIAHGFEARIEPPDGALREPLRLVRLTSSGMPVGDALEQHGHVPLPPYIHREDRPADRERYQTVYAREKGSVAAPTAGLHFTPGLLERLQARGIGTAELVLHVGPGTFRPVEVADVRQHRVDAEPFSIPEASARAIVATKAAGGRVVAVGTTATRALEAAADEDGGVRAGEGRTDLVLVPGARFRVVDALVTNFHLPRSSLLLLVSAFAGRERVLSAYAEAVARGYRFYSYGDAMLLL